MGWKMTTLLCLISLGLSTLSRDHEGTQSPPKTLRESWQAYVRRFIQEDGRVIDYSAGAISTSEGQAYAMLRAVWMRDRANFDKTYTWALNNLNSGVRGDHLWAWKWGRAADKSWRVLDRAFASDADQDAALALILASRTWNEPMYLERARAVLSDLWTLGTIEIDGTRYLLGGDSLCHDSACKVNPSYYAPYAYRIFKKFDSTRDWMALVDGSYLLLEAASNLTETRLPPDWIRLDRETGRLSLAGGKDNFFSYDALRVFWRIAMDKELFGEPRAGKYFQKALPWLAGEWRRQGRLSAIISHTGQAKAEYESLEMLAALMPAFQRMEPGIAEAMSTKLRSAYSRGMWADRDSYYLQNWAWFGIALRAGYLAPYLPFL